MDYAFAVGAASAGAALMILLRPLRPVALLLFAVSGYALRDTPVGGLIRQGLSIAGKWLGNHGAAGFVPWLGLAAAIVVGYSIAEAVWHRSVGFGTALLAVVFPTLLVLSGGSPPADAILNWLGWLTDQIATATVTKGTR